MRFPFNKYFSVLCLAALSLFSGGCVDDKGEGCPEDVRVDAAVVLSFTCDYNLQEIDRFDDEIGMLEVFIFDTRTGDAVLRESFSPENCDDLRNVRVMVPEGVYDAVVWANAQSRFYRIVDAGNIGRMRVETITGSDNTLESTYVPPLYYGSAGVVSVSEKTVTVPVTLKGNTNRVEIVISGVEFTGKPEDEVTVNIVGSNGDYDFYRDLIAERTLTYLPSYDQNKEDNILLSHFIVHRILINGDLRVLSSQAGYSPGFFDYGVSELISRSFRGEHLEEYLEKADEFLIRLRVIKHEDGMYGAISVQVNDWEPINFDTPI